MQPLYVSDLIQDFLAIPLNQPASKEGRNTDGRPKKNLSQPNFFWDVCN